MAIEDIGRENPKELTLNNYSKNYLRETAKWSKFLSILGFIGIGLLIVFAFLGEAISASTESSDVFSASFEGGIFGTIFVLILAGIYFIPIYYLFQFSNKMKKALDFKEEEMLTKAFEMLKSHYKFVGIFTIIILSLYLLAFGIGLMAFLAS